MNEQLLPMDLGPLNPSGYGLIVGLLCFIFVFVVLSKRLLPRISDVIAERERKTAGVLEESEQLRAEAAAVRAGYDARLAEARHDAARTRQRAYEEGTALIVAARAEGLREREEIITAGTARIEAERAASKAELRDEVDAWAQALAERILGEPLGVSASGRRTGD
jgi:F-type H+-transporting ATPase subunit b